MDPMIKAVLFDLDGTILDRLSCLRVYLYKVVERLPDVFDPVPFQEYMDRLVSNWTRMGMGTSTRFSGHSNANLGCPRGQGSGCWTTTRPTSRTPLYRFQRRTRRLPCHCEKSGLQVGPRDKRSLPHRNSRRSTAWASPVTSGRS